MLGVEPPNLAHEGGISITKPTWQVRWKGVSAKQSMSNNKQFGSVQGILSIWENVH